MPEWVTVARAEDLPDGEMIGSQVGGLQMLVANVGGQYHAIRSVEGNEIQVAKPDS